MRDNNDQLALDAINNWEDNWSNRPFNSCQARSNLQNSIIDLLENKDLQIIKAEARSEMWEEAHKYISQLLHGEN